MDLATHYSFIQQFPNLKNHSIFLCMCSNLKHHEQISQAFKINHYPTLRQQMENNDKLDKVAFHVVNNFYNEISC
jgi:hypothetical protein